MSRLILIVLYAVTSVLHAVEEPGGYRLDRYDDIVPQTLEGATTVTALDIIDLQRTADVLIVDVIPEHRKPPELPAGQLWIPVPHTGIKGALWLPDVGFGGLSEVTEQYFKSHLERASHGDLDKPIVFYCRADCWMSWNAGKRALSYGYTSVYWFADGLDDWTFEDQPVETLSPAAGQRQETMGQ